jgi:predicted AlkP superfamily pyrophosphatase or phosphodiesterase
MSLIVLNVVGLTPDHIGSDTPYLTAWSAPGSILALQPSLPAVTTTCQTTMLTGVAPDQHGIVGNGWFFHDLGEIWFWRQSEALVQAPYFWQDSQRMHQPAPRVLKHFWWYAMNSRSCSHLVTPRPAYHADGRKSPDFYTHPAELHETLATKHGPFPLFNFWGPTANIRSSQWIAESFITACEATQPDIALCYLPHLDYDLQRFGATGAHLPQNLQAIDACCQDILSWSERNGHETIIVSEYGIESVTTAGFPNRRLREAGLLTVTHNATGELLDPGTSRAFAVCDHQIAHIYCGDSNDLPEVLAALQNEPAIERLFVGPERQELGLNHPRSGDIVAVAQAGCWFAHDYWLDEQRAPDFTHLVEIHKKPGYDPRELSFGPKGKLRAAKALFKKKLGMRYVMNAIGTDPAVVRGSHGRAPSSPGQGPVLLSKHPIEPPIEQLIQRNNSPVGGSIDVLPQTAVAQLLADRWQAQSQ